MQKKELVNQEYYHDRIWPVVIVLLIAEIVAPIILTIYEK